MPTERHSGPADLTFRGVVDSYVRDPRFLARPWLADEVAAKLAEPECRFVLLTASPGAGKSTFLAQLANEHPTWPVYFVRRDQVGPLMDVGAHSFLMRVGFQLAAHHPELFEPEQVTVTVEQRVGTTTGGGVVGAEIERLLASPFFTSLVRVKQDVQHSAGKVAAVQIGEYVQDPRLIGLEDLQHMALLDPASALLRTDPPARIVVLVDALDEVRYHRSSQTLLDWLCGAPELPVNVRFVLTSRPEEELLAVLRGKQARWLRTLEISSTDPRVRDDSQTYVDGLVPSQLVSGDEELAKVAATFPARALERAEGNLGYLNAVGRELDRIAGDRQDLVNLLTLTTLPESLEGLYAFFLNQLKASLEGVGVAAGHDPDTGEALFRSAWAAVYRPALAVLAIAFAPLRSDQIRMYARIGADQSDVVDALQRLRQFLRVTDGRYGLYHATVAEFLTAPETRDDVATAALYVEPEQWHAGVVRACRGRHETWGDVDWSELDDYGLQHLVRHQLRLPAASEDRDIDAVIGSPLMWATNDRFGSLASFRRDVDLAVEAAKGGADPILPLIRNALIFANVGSASQAVPGDVLRLLAATGEDERIEQALDQVALIPDAELRARILLDLGGDLLGKRKEKAEDILRMAVDTAELIGIGRYALGKANFLSRTSLELAELGAAEVAQAAGARAVEIALDLPNGDVFAPTVLHLVARARFRLGDAAGADAALQTARSVIDRLDDERSLGSRIALLSERVGVLATMGRWDDVRREIEEAGAVPPGFYRSAAFSGFVYQLLSKGDPGQAAAAVVEMLGWRDALERGEETDDALAAAVRILGLGGAMGEALALAAHLVEQGDEAAAAGVAQALAGVPDARALHAAIEALRSVSDEQQRTAILVAAGPSIGRIEGLDVVAELAPSVEALSPTRQTLVYIGLAQAAPECYDRAAAAALAIPDPGDRASATAYIEARRRPAEAAPEPDAREALRSAYALANERNVSRVMVDIALGLEEQGRDDETREALDGAAEAARRYLYSDFRASALAEVASAMGQVGYAEGLELLREPIGELPDEWLKVEPMAALAGALGSSEQAAAAAALAHGVLHADDALLPVESVVTSLAGLPADVLSAQELRALLDTVVAMGDERQRAKGLKAMIAGVVARRDASALGRLDEAAGAISDDRDRIELQMALATAALDQGDAGPMEAVVIDIGRLDDEKALATWIESVAFLLSDPRLAHLIGRLLDATPLMSDARYATRVVAALAEPALETAGVDAARSLGENALANAVGVVEWYGAQNWDDDEASEVADDLEELVGAVGVHLGRAGAADLVDELLRRSRPSLPAYHLARIVELLADNMAVLEGDEVVAVVDRLAAVAETLDERRPEATLSVLAAYLEAGAGEQSRAVAKTAATLLADVRNKEDQSRGLADVACSLHRLSLDDEAERTFAAALDSARHSGRDAMYHVVGRYVEVTDDPGRLIGVLRTLVEVDGWWSYRPPGSATAFQMAMQDSYAKVSAAY